MTRILGDTAGPPGPGVLSFPSVAAMAAFDATSVIDGIVVSTATIVDQYLLVKAPSAEVTASIDGVNIVAASLPVGAVWVRQFIPNAQAWQQTAWAIDPVAGSDVAAGTALAPLKSMRELWTRMRGGILTKPAYSVACAAGDLGKIGRIDCEIAAGTLISVQATKASTAPRALTAVTPTSIGTNVRGTVGDANAGAAFARGQRLRMVTGAATGALTFCQGGTVAAAAVVAGWSISTTLVPPLTNVFPTAVEPAPGDQYVTDTYLTTMRVGGAINLRGAGRIAFLDFNLTTDPSNAFADRQAFTVSQSNINTIPMGSQLFFSGCQYDANAVTWFSNCNGVNVQQSIFLGSVTAAYNSCVAFNECVFQGQVTATFSAFMQGVTRWTFDGGKFVGRSGWLEGNGLNIQAGATAVGGNCLEFFPGFWMYWHGGGNERLWGPTSGYAVGYVGHGATMGQFAPGNLPTLTGSTTADAVVGGVASTWAAMFVNVNTLSGAQVGIG